jgi:hypothetical protein
MPSSAAFESLECRRLASVSMNTELIVNGGAEQGQGATTARQVAIPGWQRSGAFTVVKYGSRGFVGASDPGPATRGNQFFTGGYVAQPGKPSLMPTLWQEIDISSLASDVDAGRIRYDLSAWMGGFGAERDRANIVLSQEQSAGSGSSEGLAGPSPEERGNKTGLIERKMSGAVAPGTRRLRLNLYASREFGLVADGYADNISLKLSSTAATTHGFIRGTVFNDADGNGKQGTTEKGLPGVRVFLDRDGDGKLDNGELRAVSDASGKYVINNVPKGKVVLREIVPGGWRKSSAGARTLAVEGGLTTVAPKFALTGRALITGSVFRDANANGRRDVDETGLPNALLFIDDDGDGVMDQSDAIAQTDAAGNFTFNVAPGTRTVRVYQRPYYQQTAPSDDKPIVVKLGKAQVSSPIVFGVQKLPD